MKFKVGDRIIPAVNKDHLDRVVIGYQSNGYVVYEYPSPDGYPRLCSAAECGFKLKPVKKEGWVNIYPGRIIGYNVRDTEAEAKRCADANCIATVKVEWEE